MNYHDTLNFLYSQLPMYSRIGKAAYKENLNNIIQLSEYLNHPEKKFKNIHIAGTNGKGSTSHMLAAIFQEHGFKTGLYTSPHLKDFRERIKINGVMIAENEVTEFVRQHQNIVTKIGCSFFEWCVGLAYSYFAEQQVDIAIIETGLGGRLDSTNIITPQLSVITNVSFDHIDILGNTLPEIATEKAGIIKTHVPVIIGERNEKTDEIFSIKANAMQSPISFAEDQWHYKNSSELHGKLLITFEYKQQEIWNLNLDLTGTYQIKNVTTVLEACRVLNKMEQIFEKEKIILALSKIKMFTGLRGRWEILNQNPVTIADTAHNPAGIRQAMKQLHQDYPKKKHLVLGFVKEKNLDEILHLFPKDGVFYFCAPDIPRGLPAEILKDAASKFGLAGAAYRSVKDAYKHAVKMASDDDVIYIGGSTFVVAEVL